MVVFFILDILWLGVIAKNFYQDQLGALFRENVNWGAAALFYSIFILGMVVFVIHPALKAGSVKLGLMLGMFFGLVTYATYDLTNLATLKNWPLKMVIVDIGWGIVMGGTVSASICAIAKRIF
jgi:uncharacterized membrane protein